MNRAVSRTAVVAVAGVLTGVGAVFQYFVTDQLYLGAVPVSAVVLVPAAVLAGAAVARRAAAALKRRVLSIEVLVTIAAVGAIFLGEYFEAAAVTFLFSLGGVLEGGAMRRTRNALRDLWEAVPSTATVVTDSGERVLPIGDVSPGDTVLVRPGERIPVDGTVSNGESAVDESTITGESVPAEKAPGDTVFTSTLNQHGALYVLAQNMGSDSVVARIIARVEEAQDSQTRGERIIERFSRYYTPTIILGSLAYLIVTGDVHVALTLLVVSCPGALVIAAPVAVIASIGRAAKRGVLIRGGAELEAAARVDVFVTDKTGTLTTGALAVSRVVAFGEALGPPPGTREPGTGEPGVREAAVLAWAAIAEGPSEHPIGRAIRTHAESLLGTLPRAEQFTYQAGSGVAGTHVGHTIEVSRPRPAGHFVSTVESTECERLDEAVAVAGRDGMTAVVVYVDSRPVGMIGVADTIRSDAAEAVAEIRRAGPKRIVLLTGDNEAVAAAVAARVGLDEYHAGLVPEQKLAFIRRLQSEGHRVAMLGDGVNDAPALAAADVGIAIGLGGTDLAVEAADLALMSDRLAAIPETLRAARRAVATIRQNLGIAVATVMALFAGVLFGEIHMAGGMLIHQLSILVVIANGLRLTRR